MKTPRANKVDLLQCGHALIELIFRTSLGNTIELAFIVVFSMGKNYLRMRFSQ